MDGVVLIAAVPRQNHVPMAAEARDCVTRRRVPVRATPDGVARTVPLCLKIVRLGVAPMETVTPRRGNACVSLGGSGKTAALLNERVTLIVGPMASAIRCPGRVCATPATMARVVEPQ